jgi:polar amino acid transport system substrate-binding protein
MRAGPRRCPWIAARGPAASTQAGAVSRRDCGPNAGRARLAGGLVAARRSSTGHIEMAVRAINRSSAIDRLAMVWLAIAMATLAPSPAAADRLDDIKARGRIIVGVSDTTPPFSFRRAGEDAVAGYDIDLIHGVARRLGVAVETVSLSSADRIPMLQAGKLDFVATSMTRTAARLHEVDFSHIYFVSPHAVIVKAASGITSVHQLAGRKVSSARTSTAGENIKEVVPQADIVYVENYAVAFAALKDGAVDAFATDESVLRSIVRQDGTPDAYRFVPDFTKSRNVGFALNKDEPRLKQAINDALLDIESSGEAARIFDAWFGPGSEMPMTRSFRIRAD